MMNCFSSPFAFFWVIRVAVFSPEKLVENTWESVELLKYKIKKVQMERLLVLSQFTGATTLLGGPGRCSDPFP